VTDTSGPTGNYGQELDVGDTSWVSNDRMLVFGGYGSQVNLRTLGQPRQHWFDDEMINPGSSGDIADGALSPDRTRFAAVRNTGTAVVYAVSGDAATGIPAPPTAVCDLNGVAQFDVDPTWSPDGGSLAAATPEGIEILTLAADFPAATCEQSTLASIAPPGATQPDWANVALVPTDPPGTGGPGAPPATTGGPESESGAPTPTTATVKGSIRKIALAKALRSGLPVSVRGARAGTLKLRAKAGGKVVAAGSAKVGAGGRATVRLRFTKAGKKALRGKRKAKLVVSGGGVRVAVTLRR
jgi:hypothetical protein